MTNGPDVSGVLTDLTQTAAPQPPSAKKTRPGDKAEGPTETLGTREQLRRCWHPVTLALRLVFSICTKLFPVSDSSRWVVPEHRRSFPGPQGVCVCVGGRTRKASRQQAQAGAQQRSCRLSVTGRVSRASEAEESCCHGDGPATEGPREQAARQAGS